VAELAAVGLKLDDHAGVRVVTFDRPQARNALDTEMRDDLIVLLRDADGDPSITCVVLTGTDPAFTAGVDFKDVRPTRSPVDPGTVLRAMTTPVLCAVNGACVSGGLEIVLSATFAVASERARFADTHARLNAVATWGLTALLPRAVGLRKAREMSITGDFVGATDALRLGLVNHVVAHDDLLPFTLELASHVASTPAVAEVLALYEWGQDLSLSSALVLERSHTAGRAFDPAAFAAAGRDTAARAHGWDGDGGASGSSKNSSSV
jgi:enoyl-CoA hydratase